MKLLRPALALLALSPLVFARLEENLPVTTYGLVKIESLAKTRKNLDANPLAAAFKAEKFTAYLKPLTDKFSTGDNAAKFADFEKHRDALLEAFKGEVLFAVVKTPDPVPGHLPYDYILLADTESDDTALAALLKKLEFHQPTPAKDAADAKDSKSDAPVPQADEDADEETAEPVASTGARPKPVAPELFSTDEEHHGITLHTLQVKVDDKPVTVAGWALVEKTFIYATAPNVLRDLVDARRDGRKSSFTTEAVYKANREAVEDSDAWLLLNTPLIAGTLRDLVAEKAKDADGNPKPGIMGMDTLKAFDSLGLDAVSHFRLSVTLRPDDTRTDSALAWTENRGLIRLVTEPIPKDAAPDLSVLPSGVMAASAARADISKALAIIEGLLRDALPLAAPMFDMQLDKVKNEQGLDIRGSILANFGDEAWTFSDPLPELAEGAPPQASTVIVISLKDETKLNSFVETLAGKVAAQQTGDGNKSLFDERELLGVKIRTVKNLPPTTPRIQYAVNKGRLFFAFGESKLLDRCIAQFNDPKGGLAADPAFKAGLAKLPRGESSVLYYDLGEYLATMGRAFSAGFSGRTARGKNADLPKLDAAKAPVAADLPFVAVGTTVLHDKELTSRTIVLRKPDATR